jgi:hypothetical protein
MTANGPPVSLDEPLRTRVQIPDTAESGIVMVNAQVDGRGDVAAVELCTAADASLASRALQQVVKMKFSPSHSQRQAYVQVQFVPAGPRN